MGPRPPPSAAPSRPPISGVAELAASAVVLGVVGVGLSPPHAAMNRKARAHAIFMRDTLPGW